LRYKYSYRIEDWTAHDLCMSLLYITLGF